MATGHISQNSFRSPGDDNAGRSGSGRGRRVLREKLQCAGRARTKEG
jgi:hypothetical protein